MTVRVEVITPCEHNEWNPHRSGDGEITASSDGAEIMAVICRGATRKAFTEWPPEAIEAVRKQLEHRPNDLEAALAVGWETLTGDNK